MQHVPKATTLFMAGTDLSDVPEEAPAAAGYQEGLMRMSIKFISDALLANIVSTLLTAAVAASQYMAIEIWSDPQKWFFLQSSASSI